MARLTLVVFAGPTSAARSTSCSKASPPDERRRPTAAGLAAMAPPRRARVRLNPRPPHRTSRLQRHRSRRQPAGAGSGDVVRGPRARGRRADLRSAGFTVAPEARGHGVPEVMLAVNESRLRLLVACGAAAEISATSNAADRRPVLGAEADPAHL